MATKEQISNKAKTDYINKKRSEANLDDTAQTAALNARKGSNPSAVTKIQYTMFASGVFSAGRDSELKDKNYTDNIAILFDAVVSHSLSLTTDKTSYPIDSKATRSDHAVNKDGEFSFSAYVNTSPMYIMNKNYIDQDTNKEKPVESNRPKKAYDALVKIREAKTTVTLVTEDFILTDYIITGLDVKRDSSEGSALVFDITLQEYRAVEVGKTTIKANRVKALQKNKNSGNKNSAPKDLEFSEMKSPIKTSTGKAIEAQLEKVGITVPKIDTPAGVIKPDGTIVRNK